MAAGQSDIIPMVPGGPRNYPATRGWSGTSTARAWFAGLLLCLLALPAAAQTPEPEPEPGVTTRVLAQAEIAFSADSAATVRPAADITVDGPLAIGDQPLLRAYTRLRIFGVPGQTVDLTDVATFTTARADAGLYRRVGAIGGLWTSVVGEYGFSASRGDDPAPLRRYPRKYGAGLRIEDRSDGKLLQVTYGRDEIAGPRGKGQLQISGSVPLALAKGAIVLGGDAVLSVLRSDEPQTDVFRLWVALDPARALAELAK